MAINDSVRINEGIRVPEVRAIGANGENLGVIPTREGIRLAMEAGLDLIEISPNAQPPVAKIADYGKYKYELKKKASQAKAKAHVTETKSAQVKIGTGGRDREIKAERIAAWLKEGHRVKIDLFLWGRYKYMEFEFLKSRLERFLAIIPESFKIADEIKRSPKGLTTIIERAGSGKAWVPPASALAPLNDDMADEEPETVPNEPSADIDHDQDQ
ncbi:MAG TPA: translation initiation factor IF-3 [Candidatus Paceibacterota bacterium]|nr:translation initiation factor IF-3 [Candidatus Paceibacterota bacterium]